MRITLIRHGEPAYKLKGIARAKDLDKIAAAYDMSGIVGIPPPETNIIKAGEPFVICSHLKRSLESAKALGFSCVDVSDPLYRETAIPYPDRGSVPLPLNVWIVGLRLMWLLGFSKNGESLMNARKRASEAAQMLVEFAEQHEHVVLVGHGLMNRFIGKALMDIGWFGPSQPGKGYWEFGIYEQIGA
jgi:broad specificity phosphatase PhoE